MGCTGNHVADHAFKAHLLAVLRAVNPVHAIGLKSFNFGGQNNATAAAKHLNVAGVIGLQLIDHVLEKFIVPALVGTHGQAIGIFLNGGIHQFLNRTVVPQVNDFSTLALQQTANHVDCGVVPVE